MVDVVVLLVVVHAVIVVFVVIVIYWFLVFLLVSTKNKQVSDGPNATPRLRSTRGNPKFPILDIHIVAERDHLVAPAPPQRSRCGEGEFT